MSPIFLPRKSSAEPPWSILLFHLLNSFLSTPMFCIFAQMNEAFKPAEDFNPAEDLENAEDFEHGTTVGR